MKKVAILFTSFGGLVNDLKAHFDAAGVDIELMRIADESLIADVKRYGELTPNLALRAVRHMETAYLGGADYIICACSSIGEAAEIAAKMLPVPVVRIDEAMLRRAIAAGRRIGVLASLGATIVPTCDYLSRLAQAEGKDIEIVSCTAKGAYEAQAAKNRELHDDLLEAAAKEIADRVDVIVLAQGSMARVQDRLAQCTGLPVFSSPELCAKAVIAKLFGEA